jgi:hypothetical protein
MAAVGKPQMHSGNLTKNVLEASNTVKGYG